MLFRILLPEPRCPVCEGHCVPHDVVDFHKTCVEQKGLFLSLSGIPVYYFLCEECGFVFAPEFSSWTQADFAKFIYNQQYADIDPDFKTVRPEINAQGLLKLFPAMNGVKHLDYGGGAGYLSDILHRSGWDSRTYDPYAGEHRVLPPDSRFQLITSFEVFEHVPDPVKLLDDLGRLLDDDGVLFFSTELSDGHVQRYKRIDWWYISPRNGHISIYSKESLRRLAERAGYRYYTILDSLHVFWKKTPAWAAHILPKG